MKKRWHWTTRLLSTSLAASQVLCGLPTLASAEGQTQATKKASQPSQPVVQPNRKRPNVPPPPMYPVFSAQPTAAEISRARVFDEPFVPILVNPSPQDNRALAHAILAYLHGSGGEETQAFETFLEGHATTPWRASILTGLGIVYRRTGYFSRALKAWEEAWAIARKAQEPRERALANRAIGELAQLNARLGRFEELRALLEEVEGREIGGSAEQELTGARQGLAMMEDRPTEAFTCGPMALDRILAYKRADYVRDPKIMAVRGTRKGTSLLQIRDLSASLESPMQMAERESSSARVLAPAMVHWKAGHFAAVVDQADGRFLIQDPTFGEELWVSRKAFEEESSGYFLVPQGALPEGWRGLSDEEGGGVWGKGPTNVSNPQNQRPCDHQSGGNGGNCNGAFCRRGGGMAVYSFHTMLVNLNINDSPVAYSPPRGPAVHFQATYNHREVFQPDIPYYSNLGPKWTYGWLSWVEDDPAQPAQPVNVYLRGGGQETYSGYSVGTQSYAPNFDSRADVVRVSTSPLRYERRMSDGSKEVFEQPDGALTFPRKVFLTHVVDPQGNALTFSYDSNLRLVAVTDAIGQVTTLTYELTGQPLLVTKVTDPFGRFARFEYSAGRLVKIVDVIGLESQFEYGPGDFITALITPYGRTSFERWEEGRRFWLEATDPLGAKERLEYLNVAVGPDANVAAPYGQPDAEIPTGFSPGANANGGYRNTFFWDKRASALYPGQYTKAKIIHWLHGTSMTQTAGVIENEKNALEATRTFYRYPGQSWIQSIGTHAQPSGIGKVMDDGSSQIWQYEYNSKGSKTRVTDPLGRETLYEYDANEIDLLRVKQKNPASAGGYDLLQSFTYDAQHRPLTIKDAAGQTTTHTYNTAGQLLTIVTPPRGSLTEAQRTTTYSYDTNGYVESVTGPAAGATTSYGYDGYGRVRTVTTPDAYTVTTDFDALDRPTRVTYPDDTFEQIVYNRLDVEQRRDRLGHWSHTFHDALRRVVSTRDPLGRTITQQWCSCGSMDKLIDGNGNATSWERDLQGRVTREVRADNSSTQYTYENTTSRLKQVTDRKGQVKTLAYFLDDELQQITYPSPLTTPNVNYAYDTAYNRVVTRVDGTGTTSYTYFPVTVAPTTLGATRLASMDGPLTNDTISYGYDELGRTITRAIGGVTETWGYDALGRLVSDTNGPGLFQYSYFGVTGRLASLTYPNGQSTTYGYDSVIGDLRLQEIHNKRLGGGTLSKFNYTYDAMGDIKTWTEQADSNPATVWKYGYDAADQLAAATKMTTGSTPTILSRYAYSYDSAGNRTTEQIGDNPTQATYNNMNELTGQQAGGAVLFRGTVNEPATVTVGGQAAGVATDNTFQGQANVPAGTSNVQVRATDPSGNIRTNTYQVAASGTSQTLTYDLNGNLTSDAAQTFEWDAEDRLIAVNQGAFRSELTYDGESKRVRIVEKENGSVTSDKRFLWCGREICEQRDSSGATVQRRFFDQGFQEGTAKYFYAKDHLGSIRETSDNSGTLQLRLEFDPYGRPNTTAGSQPSTWSTFGYTGHLHHWERGVILAPYRGYLPAYGRWVSEDPLGRPERSELSYLSRSSREGTLYSYVRNNPVGLTDPLGLISTNWCGPGGKGAITSATDWCCYTHDKCYEEKCNATWKNKTFGTGGAAKQQCIKECDKAICKCLKNTCPLTKEEKTDRTDAQLFFNCLAKAPCEK